MRNKYILERGDSMDRPYTIKELAKLCQDEIKKGHGDRIIMLSNDDEGNGYHYCWYAFTTPEELNSGLEDCGLDYGIDGLNTDIAPVNKTILLG